VASQDADMFNSTMSIRQTIYDEWRKVKNKESKQKTHEQKLKEEAAKKKEEKVCHLHFCIKSVSSLWQDILFVCF